jgi:hypothetical protein
MGVLVPGISRDYFFKMEKSNEEKKQPLWVELLKRKDFGEIGQIFPLFLFLTLNCNGAGSSSADNGAVKNFETDVL